MADIAAELKFVADLEKATPSLDSVMISNRILQGSAAELSRLRSELEEAREIIGDILDRDDAYRFIYRETKPGDIVARARAFLNKHSVTTKGD